MHNALSGDSGEHHLSNASALTVDDTPAGREANQRRAIAAYRASLPPGTFSEFRIDPVDYLGVPIVNVDLFTPEGGHFNGIGYGPDEDSATLGAYGELCEEAHLINAFEQLTVVTASYRKMWDDYGPDRVIDPLTMVLSAGSPYTVDTELRWVEIERLRDGQPTWCVADFVATTNSQVDYPNRLATAIRNGSGAGDTETRAILHGLLELLQRDGNADCFRALDRGIVLDPATLPADVKELMATLRERGLHVTAKLARVTCGCPSVYAVGDDRTADDFPLGVTATGEGCDTSYAVALRKAVLECASSHSRKRFNNLPWERKESVLPAGFRQTVTESMDLAKEEPRALDAMLGWVNGTRAELRDKLADNVFLKRSTLDARTLPDLQTEDLEEKLTYVLNHFRAEGLEPYVFRARTTGGHCHTVKMIVPGIEQELGSYHRIGRRNVERLLAREEPRLIAREAGPGRKRILLTREDEATVGGPVWLEAARLDALVEPVYSLYREPSGHAVVYAGEVGYRPGGAPGCGDRSGSRPG